MPIYEYVCNACHESFDRLISNPSAAAKVTCPKCRSRKVAKQLSTINVGSATPEPCKTCPAPGPPHSCPAGGMCRQL